MRRERVILNVGELRRATALAGLSRREVGKTAPLSTHCMADAFAGRGVTVKVARKLAAVLRVPYRKLVLSAEVEESSPAVSAAG